LAEDPDPELVETIVGEVLRALEARRASAGEGASSGPARGSASEPVSVRPPVGVCMGNYSQFPELKGRLYGSAGGSQPNGPGAAPAPLEGIVTARRLQEAMAGAADGAVDLTPGARLTPLAQDLVRERPRCVRRVASAAARPASAPWLWWIEGACGTVERLAGARGETLQTLNAPREASALPDVVRRLADAVRQGRASGGILFAPTAARALCHANRHPALRAAPGTCPEAVDQAIAELGANVLVVEPCYHGAEQIAAMVDRMTARPPAVPEGERRALAATERAARAETGEA
jgi:ribose 5-phosphate isomerase RpiB